MADEQVKALAPEAKEAIDSYLGKKITRYATIFGIVNVLALGGVFWGAMTQAIATVNKRLEVSGIELDKLIGKAGGLANNLSNLDKQVPTLEDKIQAIQNTNVDEMGELAQKLKSAVGSLDANDLKALDVIGLETQIAALKNWKGLVTYTVLNQSVSPCTTDNTNGCNQAAIRYCNANNYGVVGIIHEHDSVNNRVALLCIK
jgi:hypothetical protein